MNEVTNDFKEHSGEATHDKYRELEGLSLEEWAFVDARERFMATTNLIRGFILRYMRCHSGRILSDTDRVSCDWPSIEEVLLTSGILEFDNRGQSWLDEHGVPPIEVIDFQISRYKSILERRVEATYEIEKADVLVPERIQAEFQLSPAEILLVCAIAAPQCALDILRLYQFVTGLNSTIFPGAFYAELLADETLSASDILALIDEHGALRTYALIEAGRHREWGNLTPPLVSPLSVSNRISSLLSGVSFLPQLAYAHCRLNAMEKMPLTLDPNFVKTASKHLKRRR